MNKDQYFEDLQEIINDPIFIGFSKSDIHKEIETNMWRISLKQELVDSITNDDFHHFINKVIMNRQHQIDQSNSIHGMIFYLWFDWMSSQLRFNLISDINKKLPFNSEIIIVNDVKDIIQDFISSPFHKGLPIVGYDDKSEESESILKIYTVHLKKQLS